MSRETIHSNNIKEYSPTTTTSQTRSIHAHMLTQIPHQPSAPLLWSPAKMRQQHIHRFLKLKNLKFWNIGADIYTCTVTHSFRDIRSSTLHRGTHSTWQVHRRSMGEFRSLQKNIHPNIRRTSLERRKNRDVRERSYWAGFPNVQWMQNLGKQIWWLTEMYWNM